MEWQFMKTFVLTTTAVFAMAPFALAAEPFAKPGSKTIQNIGATQGQDEIVTYGPEPASSRKGFPVCGFVHSIVSVFSDFYGDARRVYAGSEPPPLTPRW